MPFVTQGKANLKYILIVVILAAIVGGGILGYQYWLSPEEPSTTTLPGSTGETFCNIDNDCVVTSYTYDCCGAPCGGAIINRQTFEKRKQWTIDNCTPLGYEKCPSVDCELVEEKAVCENNKCVSCNDGIKNQDETGIDCGGTICTTRCSNGQQCKTGTDCASTSCVTGSCIICVPNPLNFASICANLGYQCGTTTTVDSCGKTQAVVCAPTYLGYSGYGCNINSDPLVQGLCPYPYDNLDCYDHQEYGCKPGYATECGGDPNDPYAYECSGFYGDNIQNLSEQKTGEYAYNQIIPEPG